jgi:hemerythrin-like domain-containing protein
MCEHCGCRGVEPIAELMDEHLALLELAGEATRHLANEQPEAAMRTLEHLAGQLDRHVGREERGVFTALKDQGDFADAVADLEAEHIAMDRQLSMLDASSPDFATRVRRLLDELSEHIDKENLGVFPVAVVTLGADGWDVVDSAHSAEPTSSPSQPTPECSAGAVPRIGSRMAQATMNA